MACVDIPAFPLQLLVRTHPRWRELPAVVVDEDKPQGIILWSNEHARSFRILPGMRYAAALSLARDLRAGVVEPRSIETHVNALVEVLQRFTPNVEPADGEPGVFRLDGSGLERLYPSLESWASDIRDALIGEGFHASIAVGFTRTGCYALARNGASGTTPSDAGGDVPAARSSIAVLETPASERRAAACVPLARLGIAPSLRDALSRLGISTLGQFLRLPAGGVKRRFGVEAYTLHRLAAGELMIPFTPAAHPDPLREELLLDYPERDLPRIVLVLEEFLETLIGRIPARDAAIASITVTLGFELGGERRTETLRPAAPTRDRRQVIQLVALRLGSSFAAEPPRSGVVEISLEVQIIAAERAQLALFACAPSRDLDAAARALARVRAELGENAVLRASIREGHLPEARVSFEPMRTIPLPDPGRVTIAPLVRRFHDRAIALPPRPRHEPDGWLIAGLGEGTADDVSDPFIVSGGWWMRPVERRYRYVHTSSGRWLWVYEDLARRRWRLQGEVG